MEIEKGQYYHIFNRGNSSRKIFYKRENYLFFLTKMKEHLGPYVSLISWCLMPNHFHWVVYVHSNSHTITTSDRMTRRERSLNYSIGILLRSYTRAIQKQENLTGSIFQQHTKAKPLIDEIKIDTTYWNTEFGTEINCSEGKSYLETCIEYVHQNPVFDGLVEKAEDWEYSSFRDYLGMRKGKLIDFELVRREKLIDNLTPSESINIVIVGIGSNINAEENIAKMLEILRTEGKVLQVTSMIKTKPIGIKNQSEFTNGAVKIATELDEKQLNMLLKKIEDDMGRDRSVAKFGPRCIDLDITVWNGKVVDDDYYTRDFIRKSVAELGGLKAF